MLPPPPPSTLFPYTTLFRSHHRLAALLAAREAARHYRQLGRRHHSPHGAHQADFLSPLRGELQVHGENERSEEHTSELQSLRHLVCRLLLEKKKTHKINIIN